MPSRPPISGPDRFHGTPGTFSVAVCSSCGCGWTLPEVPEDQLGSFYPATYGYLSGAGVVGAMQRRLQRARMDYALARRPLSTVAARTPGANRLRMFSISFSGSVCRVST